MNAMSRTISTIQMMGNNNIIHDNAPLRVGSVFTSPSTPRDLHNRDLVLIAICASVVLRAVQDLSVDFHRTSLRANIVNRFGNNGEILSNDSDLRWSPASGCRENGGRADAPVPSSSAENTMNTIHLPHQPDRKAGCNECRDTAGSEPDAAQCECKRLYTLH